MKKKLYQTGIFSLMLVFTIIAMSCGTTKLGVYSATLQPTEQSQMSNLRIHYEMGITGFDGKAVSWGISRQTKYTNIAIPAGLHTMRFEYYFESEEVRQQASNFTFAYEFLPGHNYEIRSLGGRMVIITDMTDGKLSKNIAVRG